MAAPAQTSRLESERVSFGAWLGVVLLFLFFGLVVAVLIGASPRGDDYEAKRAKAREEKLKTARDDATKELHSYAWVDKSKGVTRIPIDRAMQLTVAELAQKKPAPANPIEAPSPPVAPSPAVATSPAAGPSASPPSPATQTGANQPSPTPSAPPPQGSPRPTLPSVTGPNNPESRGQPAAAANPPNAQPGSQPGPSATPAAAPSPPSGQPAVSPSVTPSQNPPGTPLPVAGQTPTP